MPWKWTIFWSNLKNFSRWLHPPDPSLGRPPPQEFSLSLPLNTTFTEQVTSHPYLLFSLHPYCISCKQSADLFILHSRGVSKSVNQFKCHYPIIQKKSSIKVESKIYNLNIIKMSVHKTPTPPPPLYKCISGFLKLKADLYFWEESHARKKKLIKKKELV